MQLDKSEKGSFIKKTKALRKPRNQKQLAQLIEKLIKLGKKHFSKLVPFMVEYKSGECSVLLLTDEGVIEASNKRSEFQLIVDAIKELLSEVQLPTVEVAEDTYLSEGADTFWIDTSIFSKEGFSYDLTVTCPSKTGASYIYHQKPGTILIPFI